jgi:CRP/FNR family transcriptional regulator, cyclic AMP receptor protein
MLESVPLFGGLSKRSRRRLAEVAQQVRYTPGAIVVAAGTPGGAAFFVIVDGVVSVRRESHELARLGRGEFFGELSLLDGKRRAATVVAVSDLTTIRVSRDGFRQLVAGDADVAFQIMEVLGERIRALEDAIDRMRSERLRAT